MEGERSLVIVVEGRRKKIWTANRRVLDWWFVKLGAGKMSMENGKVGLEGWTGPAAITNLD